MVYQVRFTHSAEREFAALPRPVRIRIEVALEHFAASPFHHQDVRIVKGCPPEKPRYRLRVGEYQVRFLIVRQHMVVCMVAVGKKKNFEY